MDLGFLIVAAAMVALAMLIVLGGRRRGAAAADAARAPQLNAAVLRHRLAELARERDQGLIGSAEYAAAQDELQRRVLAEAGAGGQRPAAVPARPRVALVAAALALPVGALALYLMLGNPHLLTAATAAMPGDAEAGPAAAVAPAGATALAQLEAHVAATPRDARAWVMLARARMEAGQFTPAAVAYERALEAQPKVARDPQVWCEYADAVGMGQGGQLAGRPRELIDRALALDAAAPCALEMAGSAAVEARDFKGARAHWQKLLAQLAPGSAQHGQLAAALARIEQQARFALPPAPAAAAPLR